MTKVKPHLAINSASIFRDPTIIDTGNLVGRKKKKKKIFKKTKKKKKKKQI